MNLHVINWDKNRRDPNCILTVYMQSLWNENIIAKGTENFRSYTSLTTKYFKQPLSVLAFYAWNSCDIHSLDRWYAPSPRISPEIFIHWVCGSLAETLSSDTEGAQLDSTIALIAQLMFVIPNCEGLENFMHPRKWNSLKNLLNIVCRWTWINDSRW